MSLFNISLHALLFKGNPSVYLTLFILFFVGCSSVDKKHKQTSFYYWKQNFNLVNAEREALNDLGISQIYLKFFDIHKSSNSAASVIAPIQFSSSLPTDVSVVPTVFITNQTLLRYPKDSIIHLSKIVHNNIQSIIKDNKITKVSGIQLDCDWSPSTQQKYFILLERLKKLNRSIEISATIRLHQIKFYKKTGVPPVDRGMLMFYNMDDVTNSETNNSILDLKVARQYMYNFDEYPLPLDVALPLFQWGVLRRRGRVVQLINHLDAAHLADSAFVSLDNGDFEAIQSHYLKGFYIYKGDQIRLERVSISDLQASAELLQGHLRSDTLLRVAYYHLDSTILSRYNLADLQRIQQRF